MDTACITQQRTFKTSRGDSASETDSDVEDLQPDEKCNEFTVSSSGDKDGSGAINTPPCYSTTQSDAMKKLQKKLKKKRKANEDVGADALNLGGLLEVLDGVVDCPGRILVMTTNHPEKLDAALTRPGRINQRLHLGYISFPSALSMITMLTFDQDDPKRQALDDEANALLKSFFDTGLKRFGFGPSQPRGELDNYAPQMTPAEIEQLCLNQDATGSDVVRRIIEDLVVTVGQAGSITEDVCNRARASRIKNKLKG